MKHRIRATNPFGVCREMVIDLEKIWLKGSKIEILESLESGIKLPKLKGEKE